MVVKVSDRIGSLRSLLAWTEEYTEINSWLFNHRYYNNMQVSDLTKELKLAHGICYWAETNFLLPGGGDDDKVLKSLMDELEDSLYEKENEIYLVLRDVHSKGLVLDSDKYHYLFSDKYHFLFSTFIDAAKSLESLLLKTVDKYTQFYTSSPRSESQYYSSRVHVQVQEDLLNFMIPIVSEDSPMEMGIVRYKLEFVKEFIRFADYRGVSKYQLPDLLAHGLFMVITATYYSYMHQKPEVIKDRTISKVIDILFSEILTMHPPPKVREIYVGALKATISSSSSSVRTRTGATDDNPDIVVSFIDSFVENHLQLLTSNSSFTVSAVKILAEEVRFFKNFLLHKRSSNQDGDDHLVTRTIDLIIEAGIVIYSHSWDDNLNEQELTKYADAAAELGFSNWMKNVEVFKRDVGMKYPETSRYNFPRTNELGFIDGLLEDLKQFMIREDNRGLIMDHQHHQVLEDLVFLRDFLRKIVRLSHEDGDLNALWIQVVEIAYRIEFAINSMVVGDSSPDCTPASFNAIKEEIKKIKAKVEDNYAEKKGFLVEIDVFKREKVANDLPSRSVSRSSSNPKMDEVMVGFEDETKKMIDRIESKSSKLDIVSIVGMGGQGKTTLAKKVYNEVGCQFQVCAWCCISQGYEKHKWLIDILRGTLNEEIPSGGGGYDTKNEGDLEKDIYQSLKGKRYLIVLDDIWDIKAWRGLKSCFPDDNKGSRILLTTRMHDVALQAAGSSSESDCSTHFLRPLNDQESWELLRSKLFQNDDCCHEDDQLLSVGMRIAKSCKGLPFAIVTVAGILGNMVQDEWEEFAKGFSRQSILSHTDVLELSYIHLPGYLKPCLLYFGSFLQDQQILVSRLIWLWIAEGFVQKEKTDEKQEEESLEILAMEYLKDLIKRSLVMVENEKSRGGGIKSCVVHDLVHQFCTTKAKEENFQQHLNLPDEIRVPLPEPHRLCIYSPRNYFSQVRLSFRHLSSLKLLPIGQKSLESYNISSNFKHFKLLKVLDLKAFMCGCFPPEIEMLVQLRYLALVGEITFVPSRTTVKLSKLETFILKGTRGEISLPYNLLNTTELRHLQVNNRVVFGLPEEKEEYLCQESCNLESFCNLRLSSSSPSWQEIGDNIIKKIKNIRKLKCSFFGSWHSEEEGGYQIPAELSNLTQLESLKLHSFGKVRYQLEFNNLPSNLRKLTLSNFYLRWERISVFAELQNLEVLKLLSKACEGESWDMGEQVFSNIQFLKLENLDIVHLNAYSENFPRLRQLVLNRCKKLEGIPMGMEEIDTLKVIEVKWCKESVATSAEALKEVIEGLKVFIQIKKLE